MMGNFMGLLLGGHNKRKFRLACHDATNSRANVMPNMRYNGIQGLVRLLLCALAATGYVSPLQTEVALYRLNSSGLAHRQAASTANNVAVRSAVA